MTRSSFLPYHIVIAVHDARTQSAVVLWQQDAVSLRMARAVADTQRRHAVRTYDPSAITCTITDTLTRERVY